jgi:hypothetical protein
MFDLAVLPGTSTFAASGWLLNIASANNNEPREKTTLPIDFLSFII